MGEQVDFSKQLVTTETRFVLRHRGGTAIMALSSSSSLAPPHVAGTASRGKLANRKEKSSDRGNSSTDGVRDEALEKQRKKSIQWRAVTNTQSFQLSINRRWRQDYVNR